jgi:hypothetical protein
LFLWFVIDEFEGFLGDKTFYGTSTILDGYHGGQVAGFREGNWAIREKFLRDVLSF